MNSIFLMEKIIKLRVNLLLFSNYILMKKRILVILLMPVSIIGFSQDNFTVKFFGFSFHPDGDVNADNMPTKIDRNGVVVINLGIYFGYESFFIKTNSPLKL